MLVGSKRKHSTDCWRNPYCAVLRILLFVHCLEYDSIFQGNFQYNTLKFINKEIYEK